MREATLVFVKENQRRFPRHEMASPFRTRGFPRQQRIWDNAMDTVTTSTRGMVVANVAR